MVGRGTEKSRDGKVTVCRRSLEQGQSFSGVSGAPKTSVCPSYSVGMTDIFNWQVCVLLSGQVV